MPDPKNFSEPRSGKEILFWPSRWSGGMLPGKIFKIKDPRLAKNALPEREFSLEKLDKNKSAHSLAHKFGCLKKIVCWLWGGGNRPPPPPPATAQKTD